MNKIINPQERSPQFRLNHHKSVPLHCQSIASVLAIRKNLEKSMRLSKSYSAMSFQHFTPFITR